MTIRWRRDDLETTLAAMPVIVLVRGDFADVLPEALARLKAHNIRLFEITLNSPRALETIRMLTGHHPEMLIGAGTVTRLEEIDQAAEAGAQFLICPHTDVGLIQAARQRGLPIIPGALTPSEILAAHRAGADFVKLFPAMPLGPDYLRQLRGPLPEVPLIATGGVTPENAAAFLKAGAQGVALGSALIHVGLRQANGWDEFERRLATLVAAIRGAR